MKTLKQIFHKQLKKHDSITDAVIEACKQWLQQKRLNRIQHTPLFMQGANWAVDELLEELNQK